jgi:acetylornithine/succinyldiaminopimelate/putrescine aminotransferase
VREIRGRGLLLGIECDTPGRAARACAGALARGVIALVSGDDGRVVSLTPALGIDPELLGSCLDVIAEELA